MSKQAVSTSH